MRMGRELICQPGCYVYFSIRLGSVYLGFSHADMVQLLATDYYLLQTLRQALISTGRVQ